MVAMFRIEINIWEKLVVICLLLICKLNNFRFKHISNLQHIKMNATDPIIFRLPKRYQLLAEEYLLKNSEKNFNTLCQRLLIAEIEKSENKNENVESNLDNEHIHFLLAALGNMRDLFLSVFEILFAQADSKEKFESIVADKQTDWSAITDMFLREIIANDESFEFLTGEISSEIDENFEEKFFIAKLNTTENITQTINENKSFENFKQVSLFD